MGDPLIYPAPLQSSAIPRFLTAYFFDESGAGHVVGATFWVAVAGYVLSMSDAIVFLYLVGSAGDGLIYEFIDKLSTSKG